MKPFKILSFLFFFIFINCDLKKEKAVNPKKNIEQKVDTVQETESFHKKDSIKSKPKKKKPEGLSFLNDLVGKYPTKENLFKNKHLSRRLKKIKHFNFHKMVKNWNTETRISKEGTVIHASGCNKNNCPSSGYELFIDLKTNNINVFYFRGNTLKVYTEKDWIDLPKGYAKEMDNKKEHAKIGSMSNDMNSTYHVNLK